MKTGRFGGVFSPPRPRVVWFWGPPKWGISGSQASNGEILGSSSQKWGGFGEVFYPPPTPPRVVGFWGSSSNLGGRFWGPSSAGQEGFGVPIFPWGTRFGGEGGLLPQIMRGFFGVPHPRDGKFKGAPLSPQIKIWGAPPLDRGGLGVPYPKL